MEIVRAKPGDGAVLTEIALAAKRHWAYPEEWIDAWRDSLTIRPETIASNETYIAMEQDRAAGFYQLTTDNEGLRLEHLWILPDAIGRGFGRALFEHAVARGKAFGASSFQIESDPNAESFYLRMGARRIGVNETILNGVSRQLPALLYAFEIRITSDTPSTERARLK